MGATHLATLGVLLALGAAIAATGSRLRARGRSILLRRLLGVVMIGVAVFYHTFWSLPANFSIEMSLPIQVCDLLLILSPIALLTRWRPAAALVTLMGFALTTQGLATPTETAGPDSPRYWVFWLSHGGIFLSALCLVVTGFRPNFRDLKMVLITGLVYVTAIFLLNWVASDEGGAVWNYAYVGPAHNPPGVTAYLGPWPLRAVAVAVLGSLAVAAVYGVLRLVTSGREEGPDGTVRA